MFCFQCEQTAGGAACTGGAGVCGKQEDTANLQDALTGALVALARAAQSAEPSAETYRILVDGLFATGTNVNFDNAAIDALIEQAHQERLALGAAIPAGSAPTPTADGYNLQEVWGADEDIRSLKTLILLGIRGIAAYAQHARVLGYVNDEVNAFFVKALAALGEVDYGKPELLPLVLEVGKSNFAVMELLDSANTQSYGTPAPTSVSRVIEAGPFIVASGHDLHDLKLLLEQTEGKGVSVYTHGELLPAHAYPELAAYPQLKGNFGTAWQNQQVEFDSIPAPVLFTTNCLMPPRASYADRAFTTSAVGYPGLVHIGAKKDFSPVIERALELGGYAEPVQQAGINGGTELLCGFAHGTVLSVADTVIDAVKAGAISHFFLVGGCDGAKPGRNYYTRFVQQAPANSIILTLACGKYRFNDLDLGTIGGLPRIMDMGQCNDAYSAIKVALALAEAFECGVNDLPLTLVLSWYEQKAVSILLTLLYLGINNILLGPSLPAFVSSNVLDFLVENFNIAPTSTPEQDLARILA
ncbi:MAG: hydroxylamine reductase [Coriobacteriales bacterium]|jgi:hydroxylamine reductase|nr:hydroxylamine reductase [Coriobacteriales bacterium]